jgi:hypothetical protein
LWSRQAPRLALLRDRQGRTLTAAHYTPQRSDDLREDRGGILCGLRGVGFLLRLADAARQQLACGKEAGRPRGGHGSA